jgi:hypothetical protein
LVAAALGLVSTSGPGATALARAIKRASHTSAAGQGGVTAEPAHRTTNEKDPNAPHGHELFSLFLT